MTPPPPVHMAKPVESFAQNSHRVETIIRDPLGHTLVNEGRESAGMIRKGNNHFAFVVRTISGYTVEITMSEEALRDHIERARNMVNSV